jgi:sugar lactone lactonase YvrE
VIEDTIYHVDSCKQKLYQYAYNKTSGKISDKKTLVDFSTFKMGVGDGMCTDTEGRLWVAMCLGQCITCWDPTTGELLLTVKIPKAKRITSCCFGGPNYEWLFVTSMRAFASEEELAENTNSGAVFIIKNLGARGMPSHKFKCL